jgi:flagellar P-ring protein precursor FlgI
MAQGNVLVGGVGAQVAGAQVQVNHLSVGKISGGATVERAVASNLGADNQIRLELNQTDFSTAARVVEAINDQFGAGIATALDGRVVRVRTPSSSDQRVAFIGQLQNIDINRAKDSAKVIMNARTGSVVMNQAVMLDDCAISHGNLTVTVGTDTSVSQPAAGSRGATAVVQTPNVDVKKDPGRVILIKGGASLAEVVKAMNAIGTTPQDLLAILQALKAAGSLRAELEII